MIKIIDNYDRSCLEEGRNYGIGYAFAERIDTDTYEAVQPISPCKDYLNDVLYAEVTGNILPKVYGFKYDKIRGLIGKEYAYLVIGVYYNYKDSYYHKENYNREVDNLKSNYKNIESFLNQIEDKIGIEHKTEILEGNNNMFLVKMPVFWTQYLYLLSLYTLLIRSFQFYDGSMPALDAVKSKHKIYNEDSFLWSHLEHKFDHILNGNLYNQSIGNLDKYIVHNNCGIVSCKYELI